MVNPQDMVLRIRQALGDASVAEAHVDGGGGGGLHPWIAVSAENWLRVARFLKEDPILRFSWLRCVTGLDYPDKALLCAAFDLMSFELGHELCVKVFVPRAEPRLPSVAAVWRAAEWHEREAYDLLGLVFEGNPDSVTDEFGTHPRRLLLPDDWQGFPLRKDYVFPRAYQGIPGSVEMDWAQKSDYPK
jgi:NADH-quinone oxidoreductase subunit C